MNERNYRATPTSDTLGLRGIIQGLADDLVSMREGKISPQEGLARAAVAKQIFNGARLYLQAAKTMEALAKDLPEAEAIEGPIND